MKVILKLLGALLLFLILSSQKSLSYDNIGIIYINGNGSYTLIVKSINTSCSLWWEENLVITEREHHEEWQNLYSHTIAGKEVIGHICNPTLTD